MYIKFTTDKVIGMAKGRCVEMKEKAAARHIENGNAEEVTSQEYNAYAESTYVDGSKHEARAKKAIEDQNKATQENLQKQATKKGATISVGVETSKEEEKKSED